MRLRSRSASPVSNRPTFVADYTPAASWFPVVLGFLFLLYWVFARSMERMDLADEVQAWWQTWLPILPLPRPVVFLWEMVHWRVLRHFLPLIVGWVLASGTAVSLVQRLYDLPNREGAADYLGRLRSGIGPGKAVVVQGATFATDRDSSVVLRVGGPGAVAVTPAEVAVTELNGRFYRILSPGVHKLVRFEKIVAVLDLHTQQPREEIVPLITREGIEITAELNLTFRISTGHEPITRAKPYPFDPKAVQTAAYTQISLGDHKLSDWQDTPMNIARGRLRQIVSRFRLDELLHPSSPAYEPYLTIRNELERQVRATLLNDYGIELVNIHIGRLELPTAVTQQYIKNWESHLQNQIQLHQADGAAVTLQEMEVARAEAEMIMIQGILEGVRRAQQEGGANTVREIVALRLVETLEKMARQSQQAYPLPTQLLPQLAYLRQQLLPDGKQPPSDEVIE